MNLKLAAEILRQLARQGVRDYVVCAGARNAPFVKLLGAAQGCHVSHFFDERAAAFFALGRARRDARPVAVITTSGTAAAELLPAAVEAHYSGAPLVLITADRPKVFRGSAAPQAIEQVGLFSHYSSKNYDLDQLDFELQIASMGPTHINVCFAEPLLDQALEVLDLTARTPAAQDVATGAETFEAVRDFFAKAQSPLVILGALSPQWQGRVSEFLKTYGAPIYAEAHSGLRESAELKDQLLPMTDGELSVLAQAGHFDAVLRFGSVPTVRLWRDLDGRFATWPVLSVSELAYSGLSRETTPAINLNAFFNRASSLEWTAPQGASWCSDVLKNAEEKLKQTLTSEPEGELAFVHELSCVIPKGSMVMLGNSLPIREWDAAATREFKNFEIVTQRGANGIDGLVSTFLGRAARGKENWLVLGDLSALYDLNALALTTEPLKLRVVVINNQGGQIFASMFQDTNFINAHNFDFSHWAKMFGWDYVQIGARGQFLKLNQLKDRVVIELRPKNNLGGKNT